MAGKLCTLKTNKYVSSVWFSCKNLYPWHIQACQWRWLCTKAPLDSLCSSQFPPSPTSTFASSLLFRWRMIVFNTGWSNRSKWYQRTIMMHLYGTHNAMQAVMASCYIPFRYLNLQHFANVRHDHQQVTFYKKSPGVILSFYGINVPACITNSN